MFWPDSFLIAIKGGLSFGGRVTEDAQVGPVKGGIIAEAAGLADLGGRQTVVEQIMCPHTFLCTDIGHDRGMAVVVEHPL